MQLHSEAGDIVELAPNLCQLAVLWLRDGYTRLSFTWGDYCARYPDMMPAHEVEKPWKNPLGVTFELRRPDNLLRYIHVLPNPSSALGCEDLLAVGEVVGRGLDVANGLGVQKVGFIHIPVSFDGGKPTEDDNKMSAGAMIGALGAWDSCYPKKVEHVYLVDLHGHFDPFVGLNRPPLPQQEHPELPE